MKTGAFAAIIAMVGLVAAATPAGACPNGYEAVWIQGHKVCRIKLPKLKLKAKQKPDLSKTPSALKQR
jgi:hypothetical protein